MSVPTAELTAPAPSTRPVAQVAALRSHFTGGRLYVALAAAALVLGGFSLLIPSTPSYDPWAWLVWGREIVHFKLHTTGGPTWKPLPVIFTTVLAPFGKAAPDLWLVIARAGALMAAAMVFKVAIRLAHSILGVRSDPRSSGRATWAAPTLLAGIIAAGSLVVSRGFISDNALGYSEGLMTALVLIAIDRHLDGARRQAFVVGFAAALDRPELWLFWGPYGLYLWWTDPGARRLVIALFALIPVLWFLPEYWGSGHFFRGVNRAQHVRSNSPALAKCPFCTELSKHAWPTLLLRVKVPALIAMAAAAVAVWRRRLAAGARLLVLLIGAAGFVWWILIAILTQAGFSGNDRYLVLGAALVAIAGGVGWGWAAASFGALIRRFTPVAALRRPVLFAGAGTLSAAAVFMALPPWIGGNVVDIPATHRALIYQAHLREDMRRAVARLGGPHAVRGCGTVMTEGFQVPMLAWTLGVHTVQVEASPPSPATPGPPPNVIFQTRAQRHAHLLPIIGAWKGVHYSLIAHVRTFRVYANCGSKVAL